MAETRNTDWPEALKPEGPALERRMALASPEVNDNAESYERAQKAYNAARGALMEKVRRLILRGIELGAEDLQPTRTHAEDMALWERAADALLSEEAHPERK